MDNLHNMVIYSAGQQCRHVETLMTGMLIMTLLYMTVRHRSHVTEQKASVTPQ